MTFTHALSTNNYGPAKFIVSANAYEGTHTTIASALTASSSGDTIFIRPGTYTENLTLKAGVNLAAFLCDAQTPNVIIIGKCSASFAGTCTLSGIRLETNSDNCIEITGASATIVNIFNCFINVNDNVVGLNCSSTGGARLNLYYCLGDLASATASYFTLSRGTHLFEYCFLNNNSSSATASTLSNATNLSILSSRFGSQISTSDTSVLICKFSRFRTVNSTITLNSSTASNEFEFCDIESGTASAITVSAGEVFVDHSNIKSSNANPITGAGTAKISCVSFQGNSTPVINATTQTPFYTNLGKFQATGQPAFLAYQAADQTNATGAGTTYTLGTTSDLTEVYDQDSNFDPTTGTFTAPVTGKYLLSLYGRLEALTAAMTFMSCGITTSNRSYLSGEINPGVSKVAGDEICFSITALADMDAGDTATFTVRVSNGAGDTATISGSATLITYVSGYLVC